MKNKTIILMFLKTIFQHVLNASWQNKLIILNWKQIWAQIYCLQNLYCLYIYVIKSIILNWKTIPERKLSRTLHRKKIMILNLRTNWAELYIKNITFSNKFGWSIFSYGVFSLCSLSIFARQDTCSTYCRYSPDMIHVVHIVDIRQTRYM